MTGKNRMARRTTAPMSSFMTSDGDVLAISIPSSEAAVPRAKRPLGSRPRRPSRRTPGALLSLLSGETAPVLFQETNEHGCNGVPHRHPIRVSNLVQSAAVNRRKLEMFDTRRLVEEGCRCQRPTSSGNMPRKRALGPPIQNRKRETSPNGPCPHMDTGCGAERAHCCRQRQSARAQGGPVSRTVM